MLRVSNQDTQDTVRIEVTVPHRLPTDVDRLVFPTKQVYADGSLTNWAEERTGGTEPKHPAAVVALAEPSDTGHSHHEANGAPPGPTWLVAVPLGAALLVMVAFGVIALPCSQRRNPR